MASETLDGTGTPDREKPVFICTASTDTGGAIAFDLRHYGFKARTFVNLGVMSNAARSTPPAAFIVGTELLETDRPPDEPCAALRSMAPLLFLSADSGFESRLKAARAGGFAFITRPVTLMTLIHELRRASLDPGHRSGRVALITDTHTTLAGHGPSLQAAGYHCSVLPPERVIDADHEDPPQLILLDADMQTYPVDAVLRVIRQTHPLSVVPVLLCTAGEKRMFDALVASEGADGTLGLPVAPEDLTAIVDGRIRRSETLRETYRFIAHRDPVTGLQIADHFVEALSQSLATGAFERGHAGLVVVELSADDDVEADLVRAAEAMRRKLPPFASATRLGSSTLAAAFTVGSEVELETVTRSLRHGLTQLPDMHGTARVGVTALDASTRSVEAAVHTARDAAPKQATTSLQPSKEAVSERAEGSLGDFWSRRVGAALRDNRFRLVYQPISNLNGQPSSLYEVFVRLLDQDNSDILPQEFLPAVQRSGLSARLDRWILGRAIHVLSEHQGRQDRPVLFVKVFPDSLGEQNLAGWIIDQTRAGGLSPERLVIEVPYRALNTRAVQTRAFCQALQQAGFAIAVENYVPEDDAAAMLGQLKPAYLKLSPRISESAHLDRDSQTRIAEATSHAREIGVATIAAQVQDAVVLSVLWQSGVDYIQGYFMQEPADVFAPTA